MRNKISRFAFAAVVVVIAAIALIRTFAQARKDPPDQDDEKEQEKAIKAPRHVFLQKGRVIVRLSPEAQSLVGIGTAPLPTTREQKQMDAPAVVLPVQDLVNLSASYAASQASLDKAENNLNVSRREYDRLKNLFRNHQTVSAKAFEAAEGMFHNDQTDVATARQNLGLQTATLRQNWGDTVAKWITDDPPSLQRILNRQDMFVQVTLPEGGPSTAPSTISLDLPSQARATASLISALPRVDPRIQGIGFLYKTPARPALAPGLNLVAHLHFGPPVRGVLVPSSAVVWWQGKAWIYQQTAADLFTRREVSTDTPVTNGFFVAKGYSPGDKVVTRGAQMLLSEEYRSVGQGGREIE